MVLPSTCPYAKLCPSVPSIPLTVLMRLASSSGIYWASIMASSTALIACCTNQGMPSNPPPAAPPAAAAAAAAAAAGMAAPPEPPAPAPAAASETAATAAAYTHRSHAAGFIFRHPPRIHHGFISRSDRMLYKPRHAFETCIGSTTASFHSSMSSRRTVGMAISSNRWRRRDRRDNASDARGELGEQGSGEAVCHAGNGNVRWGQGPDGAASANQALPRGSGVDAERGHHANAWEGGRRGRRERRGRRGRGERGGESGSG
ncbi:unnamed protein product [Closterium sp. NIES-53]